MKRIAAVTESERGVADMELALFVLEAVLLVASIVLVVHFRSTTAIVFAVGTIVVAGTVAAVRAWGATPVRSDPRSAQNLRRPARPGDYRATPNQLFRVEKIVEDRALIEECRTGVLVDIGVEELEALRLVSVPSRDPEAASRSVR